MNRNSSGFSAFGIILIALILLLAVGTSQADDDQCETVGAIDFVCGPVAAEDLVLVPGTKWIIASGFAPGAGIALIDSQLKSWTKLYPDGEQRVEQDMEIYGACPGAPDADAFISHGLHIRAGENGHSTLYVVGHGARESIEVFDVDATGAQPRLTWTGCVLTPESMQANSVTSFSDGSLLATIPLHAGRTLSEALSGELTGSVYQWSPGDSGFEIVQGTELAYANGIEVSADETEFFVAVSGGFNVVAFSRSNPARKLRTTQPFNFAPDNLHMSSDGRLITAGLLVNYPACGDLDGPEGISWEEFVTCPRPFIVRAIDPQTMQGTNLVENAAIPQFSNITMGLEVGNEIWIGTFAGDRIAYRSLEPSD